MKVEKLKIFRVQVLMSCGCIMFSEFTDERCRQAHVKGEVSSPPIVNTPEFQVCDKHKKDTNKSMLEFVMSERLDEAIREEQKSPLLKPQVVVKSAETEVASGTTGVLEGESVQRVGVVPGAANRPKRPIGVKQFNRNPTQLSKSGAIPPRTTLPAQTPVVSNNVVKESLDDLLLGNDPAEFRVAGGDDGDDGAE